MSYFRSACRIAVCFGFAVLATKNATAEQYRIARSAVHVIEAEASSRTYRIFVKTPRNYREPSNRTKQYPVVYLNDGPYTFQVASGVTHIPSFGHRYEQVILVGISYALGEDARASRTLDFTPTESAGWKTETGHKSGGAVSYLKFLESELMPFVESRYRVDTSRRTLAGHSFGGLFATWVLLTRPELFDSFIISSPSLWFDSKAIFDIEEEYSADHNDLKAVAYFGTGQLEQYYPNDLAADQMEFVKRLTGRQYPNLTIRSVILRDIDHTTAFPINFTRASRWLFHSMGRQ